MFVRGNYLHRFAITECFREGQKKCYNDIKIKVNFVRKVNDISLTLFTNL